MRFIVLGGGCYGTFYARQLLLAHEAGVLDVSAVIVVDHAADCQTRRTLPPQPLLQFAVSDWNDFFDDYFASAAAGTTDHFVPPPFTPHLSLAWLLRALQRDLPALAWSLEPFRTLPGTPFQQQSPGGPLVVSHADWMCPVHCIEPGTCPHTRGPRHWDLAETTRAFAAQLTQAGQHVDAVHLFQCLHLAYGVGTFPAAAVLQARDAIRTIAAQPGDHRFLVGTVSRCHGALHLLTARHGMETVSDLRLTFHDSAGVSPHA